MVITDAELESLLQRGADLLLGEEYLEAERAKEIEEEELFANSRDITYEFANDAEDCPVDMQTLERYAASRHS